MAGLWYRVGTIGVTNGSKKVTGFGTQFKTGTYKPDKGHTFWGPDGKHYEVDYVESDTVLYLVQAYTGATAAGQYYEIDITRTSTIPALSREISAQLAYAQGQYDSWQQILTGAGDVTLTAPDARQITVPALSNMLSKSGDQYMAGVLTNTAGRINIEGDRFTALRLLNTFSAAHVRQKLFEFSDGGDLHIITRGIDNINRGVITIPVGVDGQVFTSGNPPTANNVGAVPLFDQLEYRHLNDIQVPGEYKVAGTQGGWPFSGSGGLLSVRALAGGTYLEQVARSSSFNTVKTRLLVAGVWRDWVDNWNGNNLPVASGTWGPYFDDPAIFVTHVSGVAPTWSRVGNVYNAIAHLNIAGAGSLSGNRVALRGLPFQFGSQFRPFPIYESRLFSGTPGKSAPGGAMVTGSEIQFFYKGTDGDTAALTQEQLRPAANGSIELVLNITIVM